MAVPTQGPDALELRTALAEYEQLRYVGTIPGVVVSHVAGLNGPGVGRLRCQDAGTRIAWRAPGSDTFGSPIACPTDGTYLLQDGEDPDKFIRATVHASYLEAGAEADVHIVDRYNNQTASDDVSAEEAEAGDAEAHYIVMKNRSTEMMHRPCVWLDAAVSGLEISENFVDYVSPTTKETALAFPDLAPGATDPVGIRRTIGAEAEADADVLNHLHFAFVSFG